MKSKIIKNSRYELKFPYQVTDTGKIYSPQKDGYLSTTLDRYGYEKVALVSTDGKRHRYSVHRLVLENFQPIADMNEKQVNHLDGDKQNNNLSNLEWCTPSENTRHAFHMGLKTQAGEANNACVHTKETILKIVRMFNDGYSGAQIDNILGLSKDYANSIRRGDRWGSVTKGLFF